MVPATRPIICLTERSRAGELGWPRKYFWATMLVAFCDHVVGNSTSVCSNATLPPWPMRASRSSHSTVSNGWTPGVVKRRRTDSALVAWTSCASAVCGVNSIRSCSSSAAFSRCLRRPFGGFGRTLDLPSGGGRNHGGRDAENALPKGTGRGVEPRAAVGSRPCREAPSVPLCLAALAVGRLRRRRPGGRPRARGGRELRARPRPSRRRGGVRGRDQGPAQAVHRRPGARQPRGQGPQLRRHHEPRPALDSLRPARSSSPPRRSRA